MSFRPALPGKSITVRRGKSITVRRGQPTQPGGPTGPIGGPTQPGGWQPTRPVGGC